MRVVKGFYLFLICFNIKSAFAQDYFNPQFLGDDIASLEDLSYLTSGNNLSPGEYFLYLYSDEQFIRNIKIKFVTIGEKVQPCFTKEIINRIPFNQDVKKKFESLKNNADDCIDIGMYIDNFSYEFDISKLILRLSIPQIYLDSTRTTMAPEADWDDGVTAFLTNYNFNGSYSKNNDSDYSSNYLNVNNRFNSGPWRLNANVYFNESKTGSTRTHDYDTNSIYIGRKINSLKSELLIGQSTIGSTLFDANPYIGMTLGTSNEMLPDSDRGYSPSIRGIAESRSKLTIKQNNNIIYQTYVNPGPYNIDNLNSVGTSGDYTVELTSAEGTVQTYVVPYSSLPNLLRKGKFNYAVTLGRLDLNRVDDVDFFQSTLAVGIPFESTLFVGTQISGDYTSYGAGVGKDFGNIGALSVDILHAVSKIGDNRFSGDSYRALYSKSFNETGTNVQLTGYRYSTTDFYTFSQASQRHQMSETGLDYYSYGKRKDSFQVNITQSLNDYGQLYVWGNVNSYWGKDTTSKNIQAGWSKNFPQFNNIIISTSYNKRTYGSINDNIFYLSFSMPLMNRASSSSMYVSNNTSYGKSDHSNSTSLYGNMMDNRLDYNVYQTLNKRSSNNNTSMNVNYKASSATVHAGATYSDQSKQLDYGASGGVLLHQGGIVFTREATDTAILVEAKGAEGARVSQVENITISKDGYALIPYATPYHYNDVELDPLTFSKNYDVDNKVSKVSPTRGAISKVIFDVRKGYNFLVSVRYKNKSIKFGTVVKNNKSDNISIADDDGAVYLTGVENNASYVVAWDSENSCKFVINYGDESKLKTVNKVEVDCL